MKKNIKTIAEAYVEAVKLSDVKTAARNTAALLSKRNMLGKEKEILEEVEKIWDEENGIVKGTVSSRYPLTQSQNHKITQTLKQKYNAKKLELEEIIDENLLGGVKFSIKDEVIDTTLSNKINQLKNSLV